MKLESYSHDLGLPAPVLAIHGNMASSRWWRPMVEVLKKKNFKGSHPLITADWLGCGNSPAPRSLDDIHPENLARLYLDVLDRHEISTQAIIVGHSYGGLIAALATKIAPERFSHSFLINPATYLGLPVTEEKLNIFRRMKRDRSFCSTVLATTIEGQNPDEPFFQELVDDSMKVADINWEGVLQVLAYYKGEEDFKNIHVPTQIIHGFKDMVLPIEDARQQAQLMPNCELLEFSEFGHSPNIENPEKTTQLLVDFSEFSQTV